MPRTSESAPGASASAILAVTTSPSTIKQRRKTPDYTVPLCDRESLVVRCVTRALARRLPLDPGMPKDPNEREAPITDARGIIADDLTDREGRKVRDLDRVGAMTPDTDSENGAKRRPEETLPDDDDDDDPTIEAPDLVDADDEDEDEDDRPDDQPR